MKKILVLMLGLLMFTSCGSSDSSSVTNDSYIPRENQEEYGEVDYLKESLTDVNDSSEEESSDRKIITNYTINMESMNYDEAYSNIQEFIKSNGGYIQSVNEYTNSYNKTKSVNFVIRIPSENSVAYIASIEEYGSITRRSQNVSDITSSYQDIEARLNNLYKEEITYQNILLNATTVSDVLEVNKYLSDVRYQIESSENQIRNYDLLVAYDTIYLNLDEVEVETPLVQPGVFSRIATAFTNSLSGIRDIASNLFVFIIGNILYLAIIGIVSIGAYKLGCSLAKKRYNKKFKKRTTKINDLTDQDKNNINS